MAIPVLSEHQPETTRILIVEDEGIIARDISTILQQLGYEVAGQAGTGADAIRLLSMVPVDLVLMDIKIRGSIDGIETAEAIRQTHHIPIVFLTAHADTDTLKRANRTEPFGYVVKPFSAPDIQVAIELGLNRHRLQSHSDRQQTQYHSALQTVSEAVLATGRTGNVIFLNPAAEELTGLTSQQGVGLPLPEVLHLLDGQTRLALLDLSRHLAIAEPVSFTRAVVHHKEGREVPVVASFGPLRNPATGKIQGYIALVRIVTDDQRSDRTLQELSYALSNDLREPVRNIGCFAQLLERSSGMLLDGDSREYLNFIVQGSRRIENQMTALRRFHQAGLLPPRPSDRSSAGSVCNEVLLQLQASIQEIGATFTVGPLPSVRMSAAALTEIFHELLSNTIHFRSERPLCVNISALRSGDFWLFTCHDNGLGFELDQKERIFNLFTKAHGPGISGNGIGLAICRRLIETAGGRLWAESGYGNYATFYFTIPARGRDDLAA